MILTPPFVALRVCCQVFLQDGAVARDRFVLLAALAMQLADDESMSADCGENSWFNSSIAIASAVFPRSANVRANSFIDHSPKSNLPSVSVF